VSSERERERARENKSMANFEDPNDILISEDPSVNQSPVNRVQAPM
jgi:hypothetical protein